jgi:hypothetical protein
LYYVFFSTGTSYLDIIKIDTLSDIIEEDGFT